MSALRWRNRVDDGRARIGRFDVSWQDSLRLFVYGLNTESRTLAQDHVAVRTGSIVDRSIATSARITDAAMGHRP